LSWDFKDILISVVISELRFIQIQKGFMNAGCKMFDQPFFGTTPDTFQAIDIDFAGREDLLVVDPEIAITAEH
jgi:hypothetical protein